MNDEKKMDDLSEPCLDVAVRVAEKLVREKWEAFWKSHIRHLAMFLADPDADLAIYKHSLSVKIELRSTGSGMTVQPSVGFGVKETYKGDLEAIDREIQYDFLSQEPGPIKLIPPEEAKKRGRKKKPAAADGDEG